MSKNFKKYISAIICTLILTTIIPDVTTKAEVVKTQYVENSTNLLNQYHLDEIDYIGAALKGNNAHLELYLESKSITTDFSEVKDKYFEVVNKVGNDKDVILIAYFNEDKKLLIYDEKNIITISDQELLAEKLDRYRKDNLTNEGLMYIYRYVAKEMNKDLKMRNKIISNLDLEDRYDTKNIFSIPMICAGLIGVTLIFGLKRKR